MFSPLFSQQEQCRDAGRFSPEAGKIQQAENPKAFASRQSKTEKREC
jgi:hypothetical protein